MSRVVLAGPVSKPGLFASGVKIQCGFTIVELIVVLIVMGILAAVMLPHWRGETGFEERGFRDQVAAALRYAQKSAVAAGRTVCANFALAPSVLTVNISASRGAANCTPGGPLLGPNDQNMVFSATPPTAFSGAPVTVIFDAAGRPNANALISFAGLPAALSITIEAETGYVH